MKTKLIYISNTRLPSEKANSYQTMQMCNSFSKVFDDVELWTGKSRNTEELNRIKDVYKYYNIQETFAIRRFFQFDSKILYKLNEFLWANFKNFIFSINVCFRLIKYKNSRNLYIYSRDWGFLFVFLFFKKIGLVNNKIFYESHKYYKFLSKSLADVDGVIVINNYLNSLHENCGVQRLFLAHDGVNIDEYKDISDYDFQPKKQNLRIVYTGSLFIWKGVNTLVDSLSHLPRSCQLIFIGGSGQYLLNFKRYVKESGHSSRIEIIPHIPKKKLLEFIEKADLLVLPNSAKDKMSLFTSPIKLFEYMASKRPIVASSLPSIKEVLIDKKNAILFEPDDQVDLAKKINLALTEDCKYIVNNAFEDVKVYTWDIRAEGIANFIYKSV
jgi:glycosyltransferase involved in cell wall biosynthesis